MGRRAASVALVVLAAAAVVRATAPAAQDACDGQVPQSLQAALARNFPKFRTPMQFDNAPDDVDARRAKGASACLGVDTGDFTGEGKKDYVLGLTARKGGASQAVIALPRSGGWTLMPIRSGTEDRRVELVVEAAAAGHYERDPALRVLLEEGEVSAFVCPHPAAVAGSIDGGARVYCSLAGRWLHVRVAAAPPAAGQ
jgi:hypothetical protein